MEDPPYSLIPLVQEIPLANEDIPNSDQATITSIEAYETNIYVGTSIGELLHFFKIDEELGYILVSRQKIHTKARAVRKIVLLPKISRALLLCGSIVSVFMLPEFSPANVGVIKEVNDICIDKPNSAHVTVFSEKCIRLVSISAHGIKLIKDINYVGGKVGRRCSKLAVVATSSAYDLVDVENTQKVPLFPISSNKPLDPCIVPVGQDEFLLTCGEDPQESALGVVVNCAGDVSRGTIPWRMYPDQVVVEDEYCVAVVDGKELLFHSLNSQEHQQTMSFENQVFVSRTSHVFQSPNQELAKLITKVPFFPQSSAQEIERVVFENEMAVANGVTLSSVLVYANEQLQVVQPVSLVHLVMRTDDPDLFNNQVGGKSVECEFLQIFLSLLYLERKIPEKAFKHFKGDPRIMITIYNPDLPTSDLWVFDGCIEKIKHLQRNTFEDRTAYQDFLESASSHIPGIQSAIQMALLSEYAPDKSKGLIDIILQMDVSSYCLDILKEHNRFYALAKCYEKMKDNEHFLEVWTRLISGELQDGDFSDPENGLDYLTTFLVDCNDEELFWEYIKWLLDHSPSHALTLLTSPALRVEVSEIRALDFLDNSLETKGHYLRHVISQNETQFTGDYILNLVQVLHSMLDDNLVSQLTTCIERYRAITPLKLPFLEYLSMKFIDEPRFVSVHRELCSCIGGLTHNTAAIAYKASHPKKDANVLVLCDESLSQYYDVLPILEVILTLKKHHPSRVVRLLCRLTDFKTAEAFATTLKLPLVDVDESLGSREDLLMSVFEHYLEIENDTLIQHFLETNDLFRFKLYAGRTFSNAEETIKGIESFLMVLNKIPANFKVQQINTFLVKNLVLVTSSSHRFTTEKNLSKGENLQAAKVLKDLKRS